VVGRPDRGTLPPGGRRDNRGLSDGRGRKEGGERKTRNGTQRPNDRALINKQVASVPMSASTGIRSSRGRRPAAGRSVGYGATHAHVGASGHRRGASTDRQNEQTNERDRPRLLRCPDRGSRETRRSKPSEIAQTRVPTAYISPCPPRLGSGCRSGIHGRQTRASDAVMR